MAMNPKQMSPPPVAGLNLGDVYYIVFRRKWLILGFSLLGFVAAAVIHARWPVKYVSVAEACTSATWLTRRRQIRPVRRPIR